LGQGIFNYAVPNNQITDPSDEANKYDHPNCVGASLSKFIKQGFFPFLFLWWCCHLLMLLRAVEFKMLKAKGRIG